MLLSLDIIPKPQNLDFRETPLYGTKTIQTEVSCNSEFDCSRFKSGPPSNWPLIACNLRKTNPLQWKIRLCSNKRVFLAFKIGLLSVIEADKNSYLVDLSLIKWNKINLDAITVKQRARPCYFIYFLPNQGSWCSNFYISCIA